jgi:signal transduction histidine kinase
MKASGRRQGRTGQDLCDWLLLDAEAQRRKVARQLHDSAGQTLAASAMTLALVDRERDVLTPAAQKALDGALQLLKDCAVELSELSRALCPPMLGEGGLTGALRGLARRLGESRLRLRVDPFPPLGPAVEVAAYRFVDEALAGAFTETTPVLGQASLVADSLTVRLTGNSRNEDDLAMPLMRLRQRSRLAHGQLRVTREGERLTLQARLPAPLPTTTSPG